MKKRNNLLALSLTLSSLLLVGCATDTQTQTSPTSVGSTKITALTENAIPSVSIPETKVQPIDETTAKNAALVHTDVKDAEDFVPPVKEESKQETTASPISEQTAKDTALTHAGVSDSDASFVRVKLDREDGRQVYEVEFYDSNYTEYDYEIDALTGNVLDFDWDAEDFVPPVKEEIKQDIPKDNQNESKPSSKENTQADTSSNQKPAASVISDQQAKEIAVAQVPGATIDNIREFEADRDDGRLTYEGSLHLNGVEYEFEIDGASGSIISWEIDD